MESHTININMHPDALKTLGVMHSIANDFEVVYQNSENIFSADAIVLALDEKNDSLFDKFIQIVNWFTNGKILDRQHYVILVETMGINRKLPFIKNRLFKLFHHISSDCDIRGCDAFDFRDWNSEFRRHYDIINKLPTEQQLCHPKHLLPVVEYTTNHLDQRRQSLMNALEQSMNNYGKPVFLVGNYGNVKLTPSDLTPEQMERQQQKIKEECQEAINFIKLQAERAGVPLDDIHAEYHKMNEDLDTLMREPFPINENQSWRKDFQERFRDRKIFILANKSADFEKINYRSDMYMDSPNGVKRKIDIIRRLAQFEENLQSRSPN